jgi:two-component system, sensor histidine kinase and response regulator
MKLLLKILGVASVAALVATILENLFDIFLPQTPLWLFWDTFVWAWVCTAGVSILVTRRFQRKNRQLEQLAQALSREQRELELANESLTSKNKELAELNDLKNTFIGMASHDLRNPLTTVRFAAQMLDKHVGAGGPDSVSNHELISRIVDSTMRMNVMLDNYLDNARIEAGGFQLQPRTIVPGTWVARLAESLSLLAERKGIRIEPVVAHDGSVCTLDPDLLELAVTNLVTNAIKFSPSDSMIRLEVTADSDGVMIRVTDQGPGLPAQAEQLFERFRTGPARIQGEGRSTGLGLYIVRKIAEVHGGVVEASNAPGKGACFEIRIPAMSPDLSVASQADNSPGL